MKCLYLQLLVFKSNITLLGFEKLLLIMSIERRKFHYLRYGITLQAIEVTIFLQQTRRQIAILLFQAFKLIISLPHGHNNRIKRCFKHNFFAFIIILRR